MLSSCIVLYDVTMSSFLSLSLTFAPVLVVRSVTVDWLLLCTECCGVLNLNCVLVLSPSCSITAELRSKSLSLLFALTLSLAFSSFAVCHMHEVLIWVLIF